jgi:hypothetical protein
MWLRAAMPHPFATASLIQLRERVSWASAASVRLGTSWYIARHTIRREYLAQGTRGDDRQTTVSMMPKIANRKKITADLRMLTNGWREWSCQPATDLLTGGAG